MEFTCPSCKGSLTGNADSELCDHCGEDVSAILAEMHRASRVQAISGPFFGTLPEESGPGVTAEGTEGSGARNETWQARQRDQEEAQRRAEEKEDRQRAEEEAQRRAGEEQARQKAEEEAQRRAKEEQERQKAREETERGEEAYKKVVASVRSHLAQGFELFGFVGHTESGKTHCLGALIRLLRRHGIDSADANELFRKAPLPGRTRGSVFDYACTGPNGERWTFVDVGGELYSRLMENDWETLSQESTALTKWLHHCHGLFMFLHLDAGHFGVQQIDQTLEIDGTQPGVLKAIEDAKKRRRELEFFKHFLLFLRALKYVEGDVKTVIEHCRQAPTLEKALRHYDLHAPLLDIPVMFFFTKADSYAGTGFEISDNLYFEPRMLTTSTAAFVARYLPDLFAGVLSQVRRFKFDFLQSYEEYPIESAQGAQDKHTAWITPDDQTPLSVGLLAGLEFVLRNRPGNRHARWMPELDSRQALLLHRFFHRDEWRDVQLDLGTWRRPAAAPGSSEDEAPAAESGEEPS